MDYFAMENTLSIILFIVWIISTICIFRMSRKQRFESTGLTLPFYYVTRGSNSSITMTTETLHSAQKKVEEINEKINDGWMERENR